MKTAKELAQEFFNKKLELKDAEYEKEKWNRIKRWLECWRYAKNVKKLSYHKDNDDVDGYGNFKQSNKLKYYTSGEKQYRTCKHCGKREELVTNGSD